MEEQYAHQCGEHCKQSRRGHGRRQTKEQSQAAQSIALVAVGWQAEARSVIFLTYCYYYIIIIIIINGCLYCCNYCVYVVPCIASAFVCFPYFRHCLLLSLASLAGPCWSGLPCACACRYIFNCAVAFVDYTIDALIFINA